MRNRLFDKDRLDGNIKEVHGGKVIFGGAPSGKRYITRKRSQTDGKENDKKDL